MNLTSKGWIWIVVVVLAGLAVRYAYVPTRAEIEGAPTAQEQTGKQARPSLDLPAQTSPNSVHTSGASALSPAATKFIQDSDLAHFVSENAASAKAGDAQAARYISKAYRECMPFGSDPQSYVDAKRQVLNPLLSDPQNNQRFEDLMRTEVGRCARLNQEQSREATQHAWTQLAAKNGDPSSKIVALGERVNQPSDPAEIRSLVAQVFQSRDVDALSAIGTLISLGDAENEKTTYGKYTGDTSASYAWNLAACSFGMDCSERGPILRDICGRSGMCTFASLEAAYQTMLSPLEFQRVMGIRRDLINAIQSNNVDEIFN